MGHFRRISLPTRSGVPNVDVVLVDRRGRRGTDGAGRSRQEDDPHRLPRAACSRRLCRGLRRRPRRLRAAETRRSITWGAAPRPFGPATSSRQPAQWSEAIRLCRLNDAPDLEAQALARRGEAYRIEGYFRDASSDLQAALAKAEQSRDQALIAASSGALGNLAFMSRRTAVAEPLLKRARDLASRLHDPAILAASDNDLGNLYASTGRPAEAASAYAEAISSAEAAHDDALAATAETNAARLALRRKDAAQATALLTRAVDTLERLPASYSRGMALVSAGSAVFEGEGRIPADAQAVASRAFRAAAENADSLHNPTLSSLAQGGLAHLYERENRLEEASRLTDRAAFAAQQASAPELSFRWDWQRARLARRRGQTDAALTSYRRAVAELQSVRQDIPVEYRDGRSSYRTTFGPVYLEYSDMLLRRASSDPARAAPLITGSARYGRAAQGNRAAGLFPGYLRHQLSGEAALDRDDRARHCGDLSDRVAGPARAAGQHWRRAAAIHRPHSRKPPCVTRFSTSANCWRSARPTNIWCRPGSSTTS